MTSKQRMLAAMSGEQPDMVPVAPDISNMVPCRLTGRPFWDIYCNNEPPLWRAYLDAVRFYQMDGWFTYGALGFQTAGGGLQWKRERVSCGDDRFTDLLTCATPAGDIWCEDTYYLADPPTRTRGLIKDLRDDLPKVRYLFSVVTGCDDSLLRAQMQEAGEDAAVGCSVSVPGMQDMHGWFDGGAAAAVYAMHDYPEEFEELTELMGRTYLRQAEMMISAKPDFLLIGASGLWTLNSPETFRKMSLPVIQKITKMCRQAGLVSQLHSCGKQRQLVEILARETELDSVNPLEVSPMGDCDLAEVKRLFGKRLSLMGNLHTTGVMLHGSPDDVRKAGEEAIAAAAPGGGFILSTGDQCGRDTPDENIRAMVETARRAGVYT